MDSNLKLYSSPWSLIKGCFFVSPILSLNYDFLIAFAQAQACSPQNLIELYSPFWSLLPNLTPPAVIFLGAFAQAFYGTRKFICECRDGA